MRRPIAVIAVVALALLDYAIASAAFLDMPKLGEALLALVAVGAAASWLWRRGLPLFVAQNLLLIVAAGHALEADSPLDTQGTITLALSFLIGNGLVWLAARGLVPRAAPRHPCLTNSTRRLAGAVARVPRSGRSGP